MLLLLVSVFSFDVCLFCDTASFYELVIDFQDSPGNIANSRSTFLLIFLLNLQQLLKFLCPKVFMCSSPWKNSTPMNDNHGLTSEKVESGKFFFLLTTQFFFSFRPYHGVLTAWCDAVGVALSSVASTPRNYPYWVTIIFKYPRF